MCTSIHLDMGMYTIWHTSWYLGRFPRVAEIFGIFCGDLSVYCKVFAEIIGIMVVWKKQDGR